MSCKITTAANVALTESLLDNWLKNNHITVNKIYYHRSLFVFFFYRILVFKFYFSTAENRQKNIILWQLAKIVNAGKNIVFRENNGYKQRLDPLVPKGRQFSDQEKNNGKGDSASAPSRFASLFKGEILINQTNEKLVCFNLQRHA